MDISECKCIYVLERELAGKKKIKSGILEDYLWDINIEMKLDL